MSKYRLVWLSIAITAAAAMALFVFQRVQLEYQWREAANLSSVLTATKTPLRPEEVNAMFLELQSSGHISVENQAVIVRCFSSMIERADNGKPKRLADVESLVSSLSLLLTRERENPLSLALSVAEMAGGQQASQDIWCENLVAASARETSPTR